HEDPEDLILSLPDDLFETTDKKDIESEKKIIETMFEPVKFVEKQEISQSKPKDSEQISPDKLEKTPEKPIEAKENSNQEIEEQYIEAKNVPETEFSFKLPKSMEEPMQIISSVLKDNAENVLQQIIEKTKKSSEKDKIVVDEKDGQDEKIDLKKEINENIDNFSKTLKFNAEETIEKLFGTKKSIEKIDEPRDLERTIGDEENKKVDSEKISNVISQSIDIIGSALKNEAGNVINMILSKKDGEDTLKKIGEDAPTKPDDKKEPGKEAATKPDDKKEPSKDAPTKPGDQKETGKEVPTKSDNRIEAGKEAPTKPEDKTEPGKEAPTKPDDKKEPGKEAPTKPDDKKEPGKEAQPSLKTR
ncbi:hypothetical protein SSS_10714, partial [Sarcoptes scabiei]